jgi:hypothetical protein
MKAAYCGIAWYAVITAIRQYRATVKRPVSLQIIPILL